MSKITIEKNAGCYKCEYWEGYGAGKVAMPGLSIAYILCLDCEDPDNYGEVEEWWGTEKTRLQEASTRNANRDCPGFKERTPVAGAFGPMIECEPSRPWWKFWGKG